MEAGGGSGWTDPGRHLGPVLADRGQRGSETTRAADGHKAVATDVAAAGTRAEGWGGRWPDHLRGRGVAVIKEDFSVLARRSKAYGNGNGSICSSLIAFFFTYLFKLF